MLLRNRPLSWIIVVFTLVGAFLAAPLQADYQVLLPTVFRPLPTATPPPPFRPGPNTVVGHVQKGPFIQGTELTLRELDEALVPSGRTFATTIDSDTGSFSVRGTLDSPFVELSANGFYFDELTGNLSVAPLNLQAVVDLRDATSVNVNLLTHLERSRLLFLMDSGRTFVQAKAQAQRELLASFNVAATGIGASETLDISREGEGNAILLAISVILQSNRSEAQLTELLSRISSDLGPDGVLNNAQVQQALLDGMEYVKPRRAVIRSNIFARYAELGVLAAVPPFESYAFKLDTRAPSIFATDPPDGATVSVRNISVTFSELMDHSTITLNAIRLVDSENNPISGELVITDSSQRTTARYVPNSPLIEGSYRLLISNSARDLGGNGLADTTAVTFQHTPFNVSALAAGWGHTCALTSTGGVKCWGLNRRGQLGDGGGGVPCGDFQQDSCRLIPVDVVGLTTGVTAITAGFEYTCALTSQGGVKCWGHNDEGQLGDGGGGVTCGQFVQDTCRFTPVDVVGLTSGVVAIAAGEYHTCALTSSGGVKCWGRNLWGQLGDGTVSSHAQLGKPVPVDVVGLSSSVIALTAGWSHSCALTSAGGVKCWGDNEHVQIGDGGGGDGVPCGDYLMDACRLSPVDVVGLSSGVTAVIAGGSHTCALTNAGGLKCWGSNIYGFLGDGTTTPRSTPVDVVGLSSGVAGGAAGYSHRCALTNTGGVKCWGSNQYGSVGDGTTTTRFTPVDVVGLSSGVTAVTAGGQHTCAANADGDVRCWGDNRFGQLGDGTTISRPTPSDVLLP